jgi:putative ABC transport system permease protein
VPLIEAVRLALGMIRAQRLKSFFSLIGAFIGVMFLVAVVSVVNGMDRYMKEDFASKLFGVNTFTVRYRPFVHIGEMTDEEWRELRRRPRLNEDDYRAIRTRLEGRAIVGIESWDRVNIYVGTRRARNVEARGVSDTYFRIRSVELDRGRVFSPQEVELGLNVAVIGADIARKYFEGRDPLGRIIRVGDYPFRVIGVAKSQGRIFGENLDRFVIAPHTSQVKKLVNPREIVDGIMIRTADEPSMFSAMREVEALMRSRRHLRPRQDNNFHLETADDVLETWGTISRGMFIGGGMLTGISLVVGGILIMNIMLVAVAERTREIGIRKALGARRRDILRQFLVEAVTLSTLGAAAGIVAGVALAKFVDAVTPLPASPSPFWMAFGIFLGIGVGVAAGVYPASRAARLDPIAALRQE